MSGGSHSSTSCPASCVIYISIFCQPQVTHFYLQFISVCVMVHILVCHLGFPFCDLPLHTLFPIPGIRLILIHVGFSCFSLWSFKADVLSIIHQDLVAIQYSSSHRCATHIQFLHKCAPLPEAQACP